MNNFGNKGKKSSIEIKERFFLNLPMVAISQRSIPKDQLYEKKKDQETLFSNYRTSRKSLTVHVLNKSCSSSYLSASFVLSKLPANHNSMIHAKS